MREALIRIQQGIAEKEDEQLLFPLNHYFGSNDLNIDTCSYINRKFFYCDKSILLKILILHLKYKGFIRYLKPTKFDKTKYDFVVTLLKKKYFWGTKDITSASKIIERIISSKQELNKLAEEFGLNNKERKLLGVDVIKFDKTLQKKQKSKSLMDR